MEEHRNSKKQKEGSNEFWLRLIEFKEHIAFELWKNNFHNKSLNSLYSSAIENIVMMRYPNLD